MIFSIDTTGTMLIKEIPKMDLEMLIKETIIGKPTSLKIKSHNFKRVVKQFFDRDVPEEAQMIFSDNHTHLNMENNRPASKFFFDTLETKKTLENLKKDEKELASKINGSVIIVTEGDRIAI